MRAKCLKIDHFPLCFALLPLLLLLLLTMESICAGGKVSKRNVALLLGGHYTSEILKSQANNQHLYQSL